MKTKITRSLLMQTAAACSILLPGAAAYAQAALRTAAALAPAAGSATDIGEIVVTAQRRDQSLQDVGIAVSAYGGEQLRSMNVSSSVQLATLSPGVSISTGYGGQDNQFSIRGVTQNDYSDVAEGPVAVYVDETYIPSLQGQTFGLFDLQRVEVLKGPQGTLFGRNATGGLLQFVINKPTEDFHAYNDLTYGSYNQVKDEGAVSGPIAPGVTGRLSVYYDRYDPIFKNHFPQGLAPGLGVAPFNPKGQNTGGDDTIAARAQVQFQPTSHLKIRLVGAAVDQDLSTAPYNTVPTIAIVDAKGNMIGGQFASPTETRANIGPGGANYTAIPGSPLGRAPGADWFGYRPASPKSFDISSAFARDSGEPVRSYDGAAHIDYDWNGISLASITDFKLFTKYLGTDIANSPTNFLDFLGSARTSSLSQELRASGKADSFDWTAGFYYLNLSTRAHSTFSAPSNSLIAQSYGFAATGIYADNFGDIHDQSYSLFAQGEWKFAPMWTLIVGARGVEEHQDYRYASEAYLGSPNPYRLNTAVPLFPLANDFTNDRSEGLWAGKIQLEYRPMDHFLVYAGVNRGVKAGGYNLAANLFPATVAPSSIPYKPESLLDYETGVKASNRWITLDFAAYYYQYTNYQAFTFANLSGTVQNNNATYYGLETQALFHPIPRWTLELQGSTVHARVHDVTVAPGLLRDVQPTFTPPYQLGYNLSWFLPWSLAGGDLHYGFDGHYSDASYANLRNFADERISPWFTANMHLDWTQSTGRVGLSVFANNIFDRRYVVGLFDASTNCGCSQESLGQPRWVGARLSYKY